MFLNKCIAVDIVGFLGRRTRPDYWYHDIPRAKQMRVRRHLCPSTLKLRRVSVPFCQPHVEFILQTQDPVSQCMYLRWKVAACMSVYDVHDNIIITSLFVVDPRPLVVNPAAVFLVRLTSVSVTRDYIMT